MVWLLDACEAIHKFEVVELLSCIPYLKLTEMHLKHWDWKMSFLLGPGLLPGAMAVSFGECILGKLTIRNNPFQTHHFGYDSLVTLLKGHQAIYFEITRLNVDFKSNETETDVYIYILYLFFICE